jgi:dienelactone hydrolase
MKHSLFFALCLAMILPACAPKPTVVPTATATPTTLATPTATAVPTPVSPFNYDPSVPFDTKIISQTEQDGVNVTELSYAAHAPSFSTNFGGRTVAILVSPKGNGPFAGIVYMHWMGLTGSNRREYFNEAVTMAQHGAVSLLPAGFFPWVSQPTGTQDDRALYIGQVIELRRAFDFLLAQPGVDPQRLGYVGHDYGGVYGGILAGVDKRAKTYVLIAGAPSFADLICNSCTGLKRDQYLPIVQDLDPINFIPNAAPASIFFQFGKNDSTVTESLANQFYKAASQPKQIEWYDDVHDMHTDPVVKAHQAWLLEQLSLAP